MDMFLLNRKLENRINDIKQYRYRNVKSLEKLYVVEDTEKLVNPPVPSIEGTMDEISIGEYWKGRDKYLWLLKQVEIPAEYKEPDMCNFTPICCSNIIDNIVNIKITNEVIFFHFGTWE